MRCVETLAVRRAERGASSESHPAVPRTVLLLFPALVACFAACKSRAQYAHEADAIVDDIIGGSSDRLNQIRHETVELPAHRPDLQPSDVEQADGEAAAARVVSLQESLEIAVKSNREYINRIETLYEQALGLYGVRHGFGPLLSTTLNTVLVGGPETPESLSGSVSAGVSQVFPWGGSVAVGVNASQLVIEDVSQHVKDASASITVVQPLLRGFGLEPGLEPLVQGERNLMYAVRDFELFRENFSIDVARRFYNLVQQKKELDNQRRNLEDVIFQRRQTEATFALGDVKELEVLRARRSELTSRNDLIAAEEDLRRALDSYRIFLGLSPDVHVDVKDEAPEFVEVTYEVQSAIDVALKNRLDVINRREQLEDSERSLRLAENAILPQLNLAASANDSDNGLPSYSAGLSLELPVDQTGERELIRRAEISHRQAIRNYDEFEQNLVVDIKSVFRELERRKESLQIQRELISDQERNVKIAQLLFDQGDNTNRDVVEAQQSLLDARNSLIREQVDYEIARLGLIRDLGILFIDEHGMWTK
jgi:outer membrane protein TolC